MAGGTGSDAEQLFQAAGEVSTPAPALLALGLHSARALSESAKRAPAASRCSSSSIRRFSSWLWTSSPASPAPSDPRAAAPQLGFQLFHPGRLLGVLLAQLGEAARRLAHPGLQTFQPLDLHCEFYPLQPNGAPAPAATRSGVR